MTVNEPIDPIVIIENLSFYYHEQPIFDQLSLKIPRNAITAIMGPSGTGKTTLLKLIGAQLYPTAGSIKFNGTNMHRLSRVGLEQARRKMGLLFQSGALFTNLTVFENVAFPLREHTNLPESLIRSLVLMKLQLVGLRGARQLMPNELSGGMARRVALARALVLDPQLIMYDEPFTGLDPISRGVILKLITDIHRALAMTTILVCHDVSEAVRVADYVYLISAGKIIGQGKPETLCHDQNPATNQFMHGLPDGVVPFHYPAREYVEDLCHHD